MLKIYKRVNIKDSRNKYNMKKKKEYVLFMTLPNILELNKINHVKSK